MYKSNQYPWLIAAHRYHNKVNMHAEWDLVKLDFPDYVFNRSYMAEKGQDYIVHYSAVSATDSRYTTTLLYRFASKFGLVEVDFDSTLAGATMH
jgi:hypothetical protein